MLEKQRKKQCKPLPPAGLKKAKQKGEAETEQDPWHERRTLNFCMQAGNATATGTSLQVSAKMLQQQL
jgi:hypothetical protein